MNITVIGAGYVGLVAGTCLADFGHTVICVDKDKEKIRKLKKGVMPIYELGLEELVRRNVKEDRLHFTTDLKHGVESSLAVFVAVNTPNKPDGIPDLRHVTAVVTEIARHMDGYKVVVMKSTVPVGTCMKMRAVIQEQLNARKARVSDDEDGAYPPRFDVVSNPEFLREGAAIEDFMRPNRIVVGTESDQAIAIMKEIYRPLYLLETPMVITNIATAEMIKYAANAFLATKISFINEMSNVAERVGADVQALAKGIGLDNRIGSKFLHVSPGYGGSCFPKDTQAMVSIAKDAGYDLKIVKATIAVNEQQKHFMAAKIKKTLGGSLKGKTVGILGLAFKPSTDDMRDSAAITIIADLKKAGAKVKAFDPVAMDEAKKVISGITYGKDIAAVARGSDALVILTEWNEFRQMDFAALKKIMRSPVLIDGRNIYDPQKVRRAGFTYVSMGRS